MIRKRFHVAVPCKLDQPAVMVQTACKYESNIYIETKDKVLNAKSIMRIFDYKMEDSLDIIFDGKDEKKAATDFEQLLL